LGIIGFLVGGELKREVFVRFGKQVATILLFEGVTPFLLVVLLSFAVLVCFYDWRTALAVAAVFGAICSATDPASSVNVLWEYKSRGPLTTMLTAIVALDDALAMVLYIISVSIAGFLIGHKEAGLLTVLVHSLFEVVASLGLGLAAGLLLRWIIRRLDDDEKILIFTISLVVLTVGLATSLKLDVILSSMAMGMTMVNLSPRQSIRSFEVVRKFSPPIYILFFVVIGARLNVSITGQVGLLCAAYITASVVGKTAGSYWGAVYSRAVPAIRRYLGFCLYQQGTIAIALLIMASHRFEGQIREMMLSVIIGGVFVLQLVGPLFVKIGIKKAGEAGLNITEEDLIKTYSVADVMDTKVPVISAGTSLSEVIKVVSSTDSFYYPVVDTDEKLVGVVTLDGIRNTFATQEVNDWLVALDIAEPIVAKVTPDITLSEALDKTKQLDMEYLPVVDSGAGGRFVGVLDVRAVHRQLSAEVLSRQQRADSAHSVENV
jgi:Kef-type K+ transport system membrane component KefB